MLDPAFAFSSAGLLALIGWLLLTASLFAAGLRSAARLYAQVLVPVLIGIAYVLLIASSWGETPGGGFGSIAEVRALFQSDPALAAGWLHYLAFDLFVGAYIAKDGVETGVPRLLLIPCLALIFLFGPAGLLLYLVLKAVFVRRGKEVAA